MVSIRSSAIFAVASLIVSFVDALPQRRQLSSPHGLLEYGKSSYTCPADFPYAIFEDYYSTPRGQQPQPKIIDPETGLPYPYSLTDPDAVPQNNTVDPIYFPAVRPALASADITSASVAFSRIQAIVNASAASTSSGLSANCTKCINALGVAQQLARTSPTDVPTLLTNLCLKYKFASAATCNRTYSAAGSGAVITQVLAYANITGRDGQYICQNFVSVCPRPAPDVPDLSLYITTPKPANLTVPKASGKRVKVLHLSDFHLDPRYKNGAEANCTNLGLCCRANGFNSASPNQVLLPAPKFGSFDCDTPYELALAALQAIPAVACPDGKPDFNFTLYTGDLVSHDTDNQLSRTYVEETETVIYRLFRRFFGSGPVYAALGNHDTYQVAQDAPNSLPNNLSSNAFSWNYDHVSNLWQAEGWLNSTVAQSAKAHYGAYSVLVPGHNLRVITINTDFWYKSNYYNYINTTNPDVSGTLKFLATELAGAESRGERVWIVGHVLSGWSGSNPMIDQTNLFYAIVNRYAPATIANIFFGHTHEDQFSIFYGGNGTVQTLNNSISTAWIGPSITPLTGLNSGFRVYEVDTGDYNVYEAFTYYSNVSTYPVAEMLGKGIKYGYEYSTRAAYDKDNAWPKDAPLNATFWHYATEQMLKYPELMVNFTTYQGKSSVKIQDHCSSEACRLAKVCYMRSGSAALGLQCNQSYSSVQNSS